MDQPSPMHDYIELSEIKDEEPAQYRHLLRLANYELITNKYRAAKKRYKQVLAIHSASSPAFYGMGYTLWERRKYKQAQSYFEQALAVDDRFVAAHLMLGRVRMQLRDYETASACFQKALSLKPTFAQAHFCQGQVFEHFYDLEKARDCYIKATELNPQYSDAFFALSLLYKKEGDLLKSVDAYHKAIEHEPTLGQPIRDADLDQEIATLEKVLMAEEPLTNMPTLPDDEINSFLSQLETTMAKPQVG